MEYVLALRENGVVKVPGLNDRQLCDVRDHFAACSVYKDAHVPQTARNRSDFMVAREDARDCECLCVHTDEAILAPHLFELALSYTDVAAEYLQRDPPVLYSTNAFWTRPGTEPLRADIQAYHRDQDDTRFLALFVYLTDILNEFDGPHDIQGPKGVKTIYGPAGTAFLADTSHLHRGRKPRFSERGLLWWRWGVSDKPPAGQWDHIEPISRSRMGSRYPTDPRLQESVRLLVD